MAVFAAGSHLPPKYLLRALSVGALFGLAVLAAGCDSPGRVNSLAAARGEEPAAKSSRVPSAGAVQHVQVEIFPEGDERQVIRFDVQDVRAIAGLVAHLDRIDLSQPGDKLSEIRIRHFEIELQLVERTGKRHTYWFYWQGKSLGDVDRSHMIQADVSGLRSWVTDRLVRYAASVKQPLGTPSPNTAPPGTDPPGTTPAGATKSRPLEVPAGGRVPDLPKAEDVADVTLEVTPSGAAEPKCVVRLTSRWQIRTLLARLGKIDWSQEGTPLSQIQLLAPDIELTVHERRGVHREYAFYWEGDSFVDDVTKRLLETEVSGLRQFVIDALVVELAMQHLKLRATIPLTESPYVASLSRDGRLCAVSYPRSGLLVLGDVEQEKTVARSEKLGRIEQLAFAPDGTHLVCLRKLDAVPPKTKETREVCLVTVPALTFRERLGVSSDWATAMQLSHDGRRLAVAWQASVTIWDRETGKQRELREWRISPVAPGEAGGYPNCLAFSPDGKTLAVGAADQSITLLDAASGKRLASLPTDAPVASLDFSPDGKLLAAGPAPLQQRATEDRSASPPLARSVRFWNLETNKEIVQGIQHESLELQVAFAAGGARLVTAGHKTVKLWDVGGWRDQDVALLETVDAHGGDIRALQVAGADSVMTCADDAIKFWRIVAASSTGPKLETGSNAQLERSLARMEASLTPQQREEFREVLRWYENPYTNPLFDGALSDESRLKLPRNVKYKPLDGLTLQQLLARFEREIAGFPLELRPKRK